jgi:hypothetical protein
VAKITINSGSPYAWEANLSEGETTLGAGADNDVVVEEEGVSAHHCRIILDQGVVTVIDLDSTNGIVVDGIRIGHAEWLHGQTISLGKTPIKLALPQQSASVSYNPKTLGQASFRHGSPEPSGKRDRFCFYETWKQRIPAIRTILLLTILVSSLPYALWNPGTGFFSLVLTTAMICYVLLWVEGANFVRNFFAFCLGGMAGLYLAIYLVIAGDETKGIGLFIVSIEKPFLMVAHWLVGEVNIQIYMIMHTSLCVVLGGLTMTGIVSIAARLINGTLSTISGED